MTFRRLALVFSVVALAQSLPEQQLQDLLTEARRAPPRRWAQLLIQADAIAEKMARREPVPEGFRRVRIQDFDLNYRWNEIQHAENYRHDLLKTVVRAQEGEPEGANALVALFGNPDAAAGMAGARPYQIVIETLQSKRWQGLHDIRLDRFLGEAYETWWSLSRAKPNDPTLAGQGLSPRDFAEGAEAARQNAIAAYDRVLHVQPKDQELRHRVAELKARHDTNQRRWYPGGD
jgi:hypothetical protein